MTMTMVDSPLLRMVQAAPTDYWNDSCAVEELAYAVERGATGATSNPSIVLEVMKKEKAHWVPRVREIADENPTWSEVEITWRLIEEMVVRGAGILAPVFEREGGRKGRLSVQVNPANHTDAARMVEQAARLAGLAPNIQVKFPITDAGIVAIEEATARGVNANGTVVFTVSQALAVAEAVERGLAWRAATGADTASMTPICSFMIGRLDDWVKVLVERDDIALEPAAAKRIGTMPI
jgi:transaldolase